MSKISMSPAIRHSSPRSSKPDLVLIAAVGGLIFIGILFIYSSSGLIGEKLTGDQLFFFKKHVISILLGIFVFLCAIKIPVDFYYRHYILILVVSVFLLIAVFIPGIGKTVSGSTRWIRAGFIRFQPSEILKFSILIYLSHILYVKQDRIQNFSRGVLPPVTIVGFICLLILLQPDVSTAVIFIMLMGIMLFISGVPVLFLVSLCIPAIPAAVFLLETNPYLVRRFAFLNPYSDPFGKGYHLIRSFSSFQNGGLTGVGPGNAQPFLKKLPEAHTDFIFSVIGEEIGLVGGAAVICIYLLLASRGFKIAHIQNTLRNYLLAFGITALIILETIIHFFVTLGLIPTTGLPLPFISYGRTSLLLHCFFIGILLQLSRNKGQHSG